MVKINKYMERGDTDTVIAIIPNIDLTSEQVRFTAKKTLAPTDDRLIDLSNTVGGGSDDELTVVYEGGDSTLTAYIKPLMTADLLVGYLECDFEITDPSDSTVVDTSAQGKLNFNFDVRTPYDGTDLPSDGERYIPVLASDYNDGDIIAVATVGGKKVFLGVQGLNSSTPYGGVILDGVNDSYALQNQSGIKTLSMIIGNLSLTTTEQLVYLGTNLLVSSVNGVITLGSDFTNTTIYIDGNINSTWNDNSKFLLITFDEVSVSSGHIAYDGTNYGSYNNYGLQFWNMQPSTTEINELYNSGRPEDTVIPYDLIPYLKLDLRNNTVGNNGWVDMSGNNLNANSSGNPVAINGDMDVRTSVSTTEVELVNTQKAGYRLIGIDIIEKSGVANTTFIGTSTGSYDISNGTAIDANGVKFVSVNQLSLTERSIFVKAGALSCTFILTYKKIQ